MHHYVKSSNEMLRKKGYRLTPQRHMILSVIQEADEHLSIDQILERVQERNPYVSLSTIYRTLELLRELGLVRENHLPGVPSITTWSAASAAPLYILKTTSWAISTNNYNNNMLFMASHLTSLPPVIATPAGRKCNRSKQQNSCFSASQRFAQSPETQT